MERFKPFSIEVKFTQGVMEKLASTCMPSMSTETEELLQALEMFRSSKTENHLAVKVEPKMTLRLKKTMTSWHKLMLSIRSGWVAEFKHVTFTHSFQRKEAVSP